MVFLRLGDRANPIDELEPFGEVTEGVSLHEPACTLGEFPFTAEAFEEGRASCGIEGRHAAFARDALEIGQRAHREAIFLSRVRGCFVEREPCPGVKWNVHQLRSLGSLAALDLRIGIGRNDLRPSSAARSRRSPFVRRSQGRSQPVWSLKPGSTRPGASAVPSSLFLASYHIAAINVAALSSGKRIYGLGLTCRTTVRRFDALPATQVKTMASGRPARRRIHPDPASSRPRRARGLPRRHPAPAAVPP